MVPGQSPSSPNLNNLLSSITKVYDQKPHIQKKRLISILRFIELPGRLCPQVLYAFTWVCHRLPLVQIYRSSFSLVERSSVGGRPNMEVGKGAIRAGASPSFHIPFLIAPQVFTPYNPHNLEALCNHIKPPQGQMGRN